MGQKTSVFSPIIFDSLVKTQSLSLQKLLPYNLANTIQVFYLPLQSHNSDGHIKEQNYQVLVLDEFGSLLEFSLPFMQEELLQCSLSRCLQSLLLHRQMNDLAGVDVPLLDTKIYRAIPVKQSSPESFKFKLKELTKIEEFMCYELHVSAIKEFDTYQLDVNLTGPNLPYKDFSNNDYAHQQFDALVHFTKHQAGFNSRYPFQIVDISLSESSLSLGFGGGNNFATLDVFNVFAISQQKLSLALENQGIA
jgi:hypothetical protein